MSFDINYTIITKSSGEDMNVIKVEKLTFFYEQNCIFKDINFEVVEGEFLTILGPSGSGKSTLLKLLLGLEHGIGKIEVLNKELKAETTREIRREIGYVCSDSSKQMISKQMIFQTVHEELSFPLCNLCYSKQEIESKINEISELLQIQHLLQKNLNELTNSQKQVICFATALIYNPKILLLDEAFFGMETLTIKRIFKVLKKLNREKNLTIISGTSMIEQSLFGKKIMVLNDNNILLYGKNQDVFDEEKKLKKASLELPFMVELSKKLYYYDLVKKPIYHMERMVNHLWK